VIFLGFDRAWLFAVGHGVVLSWLMEKDRWVDVLDSNFH
jgi:hypothetical protein